MKQTRKEELRKLQEKKTRFFDGLRGEKASISKSSLFQRHTLIFTHIFMFCTDSHPLRLGAEGRPAEGRKEGSKWRQRKKRTRRIHLLSAVVGRRNNWLLSPGKFPDQFLFMIDKNKKLFSSTEQEHLKEENKWGEEERELGKQTQVQGGGRWRQRVKDRGRLASHLMPRRRPGRLTQFVWVSVYQCALKHVKNICDATSQLGMGVINPWSIIDC